MAVKPRLEEILDIERLQQLQDSFAAVAGVTTVVADTEGRPITRPSNLYGLCGIMRQHPVGCARCVEANAQLCRAGADAGKAVEMACPHSGLTCFAVPIIVADEYYGSWVVGQIRLEDPDDALLARTAEELGLNAEKLIGEQRALPKFTRARFRQVSGFIKSVIDSVVRSAHTRYELDMVNREVETVAKQAELSADMLRQFVDASDVAMYVADYHTGELLLVNKRHADFFGEGTESLVGSKCWATDGPNTTSFCSYCPREKLLDEEGRPGPPHRWENYNPRIGRWLSCTNQAIYWEGERLAHMVTYLDVTDEHVMREDLARLAYYDENLGLPNSLKLQKDLEGIADVSGVYMVAFDTSMLRRVNDAYGRTAGDLLLAAIADWVLAQNFGQDELYRIEGDEFCLGFQHADMDRMMEVANTIYDRFADMWTLQMPGSEQTLQILCGVSVAVVAMLPEDEDDSILTIIERSLAASRASKSVAVYDEEMNRAAIEHVCMEMSLKHCVKNGMLGFDVHYQPIVSPAAGTWKALEALCRWTDPGAGPVDPLVFIRETEQLGLIRQVGAWVLERAIAQCKAWKLDEVDGFFLSVNLSAGQVLDERFSDSVLELLAQHDFPGKCLALELTESTEMVFNARADAVFDKLRRHGIRFSLDDFGTGYSSFNNLKNLPVSFLKTERDFVKGIEEDEYMQYFFYSMAELSHAAGMKLIAEGIETREQLAVLLKNGADYIQGYYFSRPLSADQMAEKLERFFQVDPAFYAARGGALTEQIFSGKEAYMVSPRLFTVLNRSMQILLSETDLDTAIERVLAEVGEHFGVSRSYVFMQQPDGTFANTHEWCAQGVSPEKDNLAGVDAENISRGWLEPLAKNGMVVASDVSTLPEEIYAILAPQGIKSVAVLPVMDGGEIIGFLGVDEVKRFREWLPEEVAMLRNLSMATASTLKKNRLQVQLRQNDVRFTDVMNHMELSIMVTDPDTCKIIWANDAMKLMYQTDTPLEGSQCHVVMQGSQERCSFCRVGELLCDPHARHITWEREHEPSGRTFLVNDSLVYWEGGRKVHMQYALDITDTKATQQQLEHFASVDALTGAFNRSSLIAALRRELREAYELDRPLSVAFVDIDKLKYANDTFGHSAGDELIKSTVDALRVCIRKSDMVGRYGGDEFIVLMPGCSAAMATERIEKARELVGRQKFGAAGTDFSFSYGIVENSELPWQEGDRVLNAIVNLADDRMRDHKKAARVSRDGAYPAIN